MDSEKALSILERKLRDSCKIKLLVELLRGKDIVADFETFIMLQLVKSEDVLPTLIYAAKQDIYKDILSDSEFLNATLEECCTEDEMECIKDALRSYTCFQMTPEEKSKWAEDAWELLDGYRETEKRNTQKDNGG